MILSSKISRLIVCGFLCSAAVVACGDDDTGDTAGAGASTSQSRSVDATPNEGADLADTDGRVSLSVPGGAVAEVTTITLDVLPASGTASSIFRYGPSDLTLSMDATLTVSSAGVMAAAGEALKLARSVEGAWVPIIGAEEGSAGFTVGVRTLGDFALVSIAAPSSLCEASCLAQSGAECCTTCGCAAEVRCDPVCPSGSQWDCETECCLNNDFVCVAP